MITHTYAVVNPLCSSCWITIIVCGVKTYAYSRASAIRCNSTVARNRELVVIDSQCKSKTPSLIQTELLFSTLLPERLSPFKDAQESGENGINRRRDAPALRFLKNSRVYRPDLRPFASQDVLKH